MPDHSAWADQKNLIRIRFGIQTDKEGAILDRPTLDEENITEIEYYEELLYLKEGVTNSWVDNSDEDKRYDEIKSLFNSKYDFLIYY